MSDRCDVLCLDLPLAERIRAGLPSLAEAERAAGRAKALADPTRLLIAAALAAELCVCDLAWIVGRSQNLVSHHVRALRTAGLAESRRDGKLVMYQLTDAGRDLLAATTRAAVPA
jgi:DNA-binding transcriptional ArsR family regulator